MTARPELPAGASAAPLRILIVIAQYPPHHLGGYELRCRDTARTLARRGHDVTVLTSDVGAPGDSTDDGVRVLRRLGLWRHGVTGRAGVARFVGRTARDCATFREALAGVRPQVVHYWHLAGLSSALFALPLPAGCRAVCDVSSVWLLDLAGTGGNWFRIVEKRAGSALKRAGKALSIPLVRSLLRVPTVRPHWPPGPCTFTSRDLLARYREAGVDVGEPVVLDSGVDLERFLFVPDRDWSGDVTLLFLSRVKRFKGLHTAVEALAQLPERFRLRAVGAVDEPEYLAEVRALVDERGLASRFSLSEQIAHDDVPRAMSQGHLLVFGSEGPEAFSRMVLEAFAVGTPVVGTTLGGTAQVLHDGQTGYVFEPGDAADLARQVRRAADDADLRRGVVARARELVVTRYSIESTVDRIEALLRHD